MQMGKNLVKELLQLREDGFPDEFFINREITVNAADWLLEIGGEVTINGSLTSLNYKLNDDKELCYIRIDGSLAHAGVSNLREELEKYHSECIEKITISKLPKIEDMPDYDTILTTDDIKDIVDNNDDGSLKEIEATKGSLTGVQVTVSRIRYDHGPDHDPEIIDKHDIFKMTKRAIDPEKEKYHDPNWISFACKKQSDKAVKNIRNGDIYIEDFENDKTTVGKGIHDWNLYQKTKTQPMRPYIPGEDLSDVSVSEEDTPQEGGMIARNPDNHQDQRYVAKDFFEDNYENVDKEE